MPMPNDAAETGTKAQPPNRATRWPTLCRRLEFAPSVTSNMYLRFRYRKKEENGIGTSFYTNPMSTFERVEFRYFISYSLTKAIIFKNRIDYVLFQKEGTAKNHGYLIYQDILYRPEYFPLGATFRYALFSTEGFDSRIYSYENDVLYAFSIPAYYRKGVRTYLTAKYRVKKGIDVWLRIANWHLNNEESIGSGNEEIIGNSRTDVRAQIRIQF